MQVNWGIYLIYWEMYYVPSSSYILFFCEKVKITTEYFFSFANCHICDQTAQVLLSDGLVSVQWILS